MSNMPWFPWFKTAEFEVLDTMFSCDADHQAACRWAIDELVSGRPLAVLADNLAVTGQIHPEAVRHFMADWLGGWWPDIDVESKLRVGLLTTFTHALSVGLPVEFLWIPRGDDVTVTHSTSRQQVTCLISTPPVPAVLPAHRERLARTLAYS